MSEILKKINISDENCPIRKTLGLLWWKWSLLILFQINTRVIRYWELKKSIPWISEKMLIQELKKLAENDFVSKKSYYEIPPRVEYTLTEKWLKTLAITETLAIFWLENLK